MCIPCNQIVNFPVNNQPQNRIIMKGHHKTWCYLSSTPIFLPVIKVILRDFQYDFPVTFKDTIL